jgi:hypothetical protein
MKKTFGIVVGAEPRKTVFGGTEVRLEIVIPEVYDDEVFQTRYRTGGLFGISIEP